VDILHSLGGHFLKGGGYYLAGVTYSCQTSLNPGEKVLILHLALNLSSLTQGVYYSIVHVAMCTITSKIIWNSATHGNNVIH